ncbi:MAG: hypothetical protein R2851_21975 [Caldilineaceae bacterium]
MAEIGARVALTDARLNVRSGPSTAVVDKLLPGSRVKLVARDRAWATGCKCASGRTNPGLGECGLWSRRRHRWRCPSSRQAARSVLHGCYVRQLRSRRAGESDRCPSPAQAAGGGKLVVRGRDGPDLVYMLATGHCLADRRLDPRSAPTAHGWLSPGRGRAEYLCVINVDSGGERLVFGERPNLRALSGAPTVRKSSSCAATSSGLLHAQRRPLHGRCVDRANKPWLDLDELPRRKEASTSWRWWMPRAAALRDLPSLATAQAPDWVTAASSTSPAGLQILAAGRVAPGLNDLLYFDILKQYHQDPDWQPDGGAIVFPAAEAAHWEIFAINPDGSGRHALTRPVTTLVGALPSNVAPAWSPDGRRIAFLSNRTCASRRRSITSG